jgi:hypothetical protein
MFAGCTQTPAVGYPKGPFLKLERTMLTLEFIPTNTLSLTSHVLPTWTLGTSPMSQFLHRHASTHQIINEYGRFIEARIQQRIHQMEAMPTAMADGIFDPNVEVTEDDCKEDRKNIEHVSSKPRISETLQYPTVP